VVGAVNMHGGHPRDERASPGAAPPEWLLHLILVRLLGGAGLASLYLSRRRRTTRQGAVLGSVRRKGHGFPSPHATAAGFGERASLGRSGHFPFFASREHAPVVLAGMRQGKTTGLLARTALQHRRPLVYTTTRADDLRLIFQPPPPGGSTS
jgi:hypothetical protein